MNLNHMIHSGRFARPRSAFGSRVLSELQFSVIAVRNVLRAQEPLLSAELEPEMTGTLTREAYGALRSIGGPLLEELAAEPACSRTAPPVTDPHVPAQRSQ